jgi:AbiJ N-terminal domain 4
MSDQYFSDREHRPRPRTEETISQIAWGGIAATVQSLVADGSFGESFPDVCGDGGAIVGTDFHKWYPIMRAEAAALDWPFNTNEAPATLTILDLVEFCHRHVSKPIQGSYHPFYKHHHLSFDRPAGQSEFRERINRLFARTGLAYEIGSDGKILRLAPVVLRESLQAAVFQTGDGTLDAMLESARSKFLNPNPLVRREALEKLWDAWERIKTLEPGADKKAQVKVLLDKAAAEPSFRDLLEREAKELNTIGNSFHIRHSETTQTPLQSDSHVDYLFHRLFSLIWMLVNLRSGKS